MDEYDLAHAKKHVKSSLCSVQSNLCSAKNDDPAGRTTQLLEGAYEYLEACDQDQAGSDSGTSRQGQRREWLGSGIKGST